MAWSLVVLHQMVVSLVLQNYNSLRMLAVLLSVLFTFLMTDFYRMIVHKYQLMQESVWRQIAQASLFLLIGSTLSGILSYTLSTFLLYDKLPALLNIRLLSINANWALLYAIWLTAYHLFHFFNLFQKKREHHWKTEQAVRHANTEVLKLQFNPHFLFNILNTIRALILIDPIKAGYAVNQLSNLLFNGYLKTGMEMIRLEDEIAIVNHYIALEKLRFGDKLIFEQCIGEHITHMQIPAGTLLTLVENAVKHGFKHTQNKNFISILIEKHKEHGLKIETKNTGKLLPGLNGEYSGLGLANLKQRLSYYFSTSEVKITEIPEMHFISVSVLLDNVHLPI